MIASSSRMQQKGLSIRDCYLSIPKMGRGIRKNHQRMGHSPKKTIKVVTMGTCKEARREKCKRHKGKCLYIASII